METYIALIRGINVGSTRKVPMKDLTLLFEKAGFEQIKTYIQSGNLVFQSSEKKRDIMAKKLEAAIEKKFGFPVSVLIRTQKELIEIVKKNPYKNEESGRLYVTLLAEKPKQAPVDELENLKEESAQFSLVDETIYLFLPDGYGKTKLSNNLFEKKLKVAATTRNWNTINALIELCG